MCASLGNLTTAYIESLGTTMLTQAQRFFTVDCHRRSIYLSRFCISKSKAWFNLKLGLAQVGVLRTDFSRKFRIGTILGVAGIWTSELTIMMHVLLCHNLKPIGNDEPHFFTTEYLVSLTCSKRKPGDSSRASTPTTSRTRPSGHRQGGPTSRKSLGFKPLTSRYHFTSRALLQLIRFAL